MRPSQNKIHVERIVKKYGTKMVLEDITCSIKAGEFISILGSSGCGKTTLLRIVMGIDRPDSGRVYKDGVDITGLRPANRGMGIVFQNYALFPNMSVYENIAFALRSRRLAKTEIQERVNRTIALVGLNEHVHKKPSMLSGGQQQRVAIARTLVLNPDVLLFDEPMSALDEDMKVALRKEIKRIQSELHVTVLYVTHDQEEAFALSDRIIVMNDCRIAQFDTPDVIFEHPANDFVRSFVVDHLKEKKRILERHVR